MDLTTINAEDFEEIAEQLLNSYVLSVFDNQKWTNYRICEIEFYLNSENHPDPYVHQDQQQLTINEWYFHKAKPNGEKYKGGTFKGLDITFGKNVYGGILIRSISEIDGKVIEGPCNVVNHVLNISGFPDITSLVDSMSSLNIFTNNRLKISLNSELPLKIVYACRRVGLGDKKEKISVYGTAEYRFMIDPYKIKKDRKGLKDGLKNHHYLSDSEIKILLTPF